MEYTSHKILNEIHKKRELALGEISRLLPRKFKDHRDFYPLTGLITGGYVDSIMKHDGKSIQDAQNRELAITLFTSTFGKGEFEYDNLPLINDGDFNGQRFFCTAKGDFYLEECARRRQDTIRTLFFAIIGSTFSALLVVYLKKLLGW